MVVGTVAVLNDSSSGVECDLLVVVVVVKDKGLSLCVSLLLLPLLI